MYYIGDEYTVSPYSIRFDQGMTEFNRKQDAVEYEATKMSIQEIGQKEPIDINSNTGLCENGRHRVRICKELGIDVKCIQINGDIDKSTRIGLYNIESMSGRDLTVAQKAIQAHKFIKITGDTIEVGAKRFKSTVRNVSDANTIAGLGRMDILDTIAEKGEWVRPEGGKPVKSLRTIAIELRAENEKLKDIDDKRVYVDYSKFINTEKGKAEYWREKANLEIDPSRVFMILAELMNHRYILDVNRETGEVIGEIETDTTNIEPE